MPESKREEAFLGFFFLILVLNTLSASRRDVGVYVIVWP